jgi:DNA primase
VRKAGREAFEARLREALPLSGFALKELSERVDMSSPEGRAKFLQDAKPLVKGVSAPMLGLMLRKRVAELAGVSQAELEERFELKPARRAPSAPTLPARPGSDPYAKLLVRVLAEPGLLEQLRAVAVPTPASPTAASSALFELLGQADELGPEPNAGGLLEVLRMRGHEGTVQRLLPAVNDLDGFGQEALALDMHRLVEGLQVQARVSEAARTLAPARSVSELSDADRAKAGDLGARSKVEG